MDKIVRLYFCNQKQNSGLIVLSILSLTLILIRVKLTHDIYLLFLIWNLFLAYVPFFLSSKITTTVPGTFKFYLLFIGWLLILPNSFYLITDFVHLHYGTTRQYLFDAILFTSFTIAGFYAGISSLFQIHFLLKMKYRTKIVYLIITVICYLSSFGIYLGRILRFNSWDIVTRPIDLFTTIFSSFLKDEAIYFTVLLGTFILIVYSLSYLIFNKKIIQSC